MSVFNAPSCIRTVIQPVNSHGCETRSHYLKEIQAEDGRKWVVRKIIGPVGEEVTRDSRK